jgi:oxygen-independent coproporphyrinogen-3 oxidase
MAEQVFDNYSFDLIYALPWHTLESWERELESAMVYAKHHLSLYQLTIEKGTKFFTDYASGQFAIPDEELAAELYILTNQMTANHGFDLYEVSNYAKPQKESIHNLTYWSYGDYIGIGPGAHGRITKNSQRIATMNFHAPEKWCSLIQLRRDSYQNYDKISESDQTRERIMMGLRKSSGLNIQGLKVDKLFINKILNLQEDGLIARYGDTIKVTANGRLLLNSILKYLL